MVEIKELNPPVDVKEREEKDAKRIQRLSKSSLLRLSEPQFVSLEKILKKRIKIARKETEPLRRRLTRWGDLLEGIVEETNFPFEGASNVTLRYAMGLARTFESKFNKTIYGDEDIFSPDFDPGAERELKIDQRAIQILSEGFNHSFSREFNGLRTLKSGTIPAFRDGTFLVEGSWERKVERVFDQRVYKDLQSFQKDYPDAESAGGGEDAYKDILDYFLTDDEPELIVKFSHDLVMFEGPEYRSILRAKFLIYPVIAKRIPDATLYGCAYELDKEEVERRGRAGIFYESRVKKALAKKGTQSLDSWDRARLFVEGHALPEPADAPVRLVDVVVLWDRDDDDVPERYRVNAITDGENVCVVACRPYDLRHNVPSVVPFRIAGRDHSFEGYSMVGDGEDLFNQVDSLFRHDNNVMMLTTSPIFLASRDLKEQLDMGRAENIIRPGVTYWVPDISKAIQQLPVQDITASSGDNNVKMSIIGRFLEMLVGVSQGESGGQTPDDPNAPARKTTLLLMQGNQRIDQCIDEWCSSFPDLGKLHATLLYQYSAGSVYNFKDKKGNAVSFPIEILGDSRLRWVGKRRSVTLTPEFAMSRLQNLFQVYGGLRPLLMQGDKVAIEVWNRYVRQSGEPDTANLMVDAEQAPQMAQMAVQKAMQQFMQQAKLKAMAKGQEKLATESAKAVVKHLTDQAQQQTLGMGQPASVQPGA